MPRFLPGPLASRKKANRAAHDFAALLGRVINTTVSSAPLKFVEVEGVEEFTGYVAHCGANNIPVPMQLEDGSYFFVRHRLGLRRKERYLTTLEYSYRLQRTFDPTSWIFRYEYIREPKAPFPYPNCHIHVNARPPSYGGAKPFNRLHLPAGERVTIEDVVRHIVVEHGIGPISPRWEQQLSETETSFREIQRLRLRL